MMLVGVKDVDCLVHDIGWFVEVSWFDDDVGWLGH